MRALFVLLFAVAFANAAAAAPIASPAGHALQLTRPDGAATVYRFEEDGRYASGDVQGAWSLADGRLCLTPEGGAQFCLPFAPTHEVGESWEMRGPTGAVVATAEFIE